MKRYLLHSIALCLVFLSLAVQAQVTELTQKNNEKDKMRKRNIDVKHIALNLRFDWLKKQAYGTAELILSPLASSKEIAIDAGMLTIKSVSLPDGALLSFNYNGSDKNDGLKITLDRVYNSGEEITISIEYNTNWVNNTDPFNIWGSNGKGIRFFEPTTTEPTRRRQIWSIGEPESNRYWFPCYDSPGDLRTSELTATVENNFTVISNGKLVDKRSNEDGTTTFHWKTDKPYANYQTSFVVGEFTDILQKYDDIELHNFGYPDERDAVTASVVMLPDMIKYFSEVTGVKYPYESYSQVFVQELPGWVGNNTVSTITENMIDDYRTHADFFYLWDQTEAEALASQWFGNHITCGSWADIWLNRSFAHYFNELYNEQKNGKDEFLIYQRLWDHNTYLWDWNSGIRQPVVNHNYEDAASHVNDNYTNLHGASVLHMLRKHLGEELWWKAIRIYVKNNGGKIVTTNDFKLAVEEASGEPMDWFFEQWLYKIGHPVFEIEKKYENKKLTLTVDQIEKMDEKSVHPQNEFFKGKIDIEIDGKIEQVSLDAKKKNVFIFSAAEEPKIVNFDYESTWIKEINFKKTTTELLYQFQNDRDILGRNFALNELVDIAKAETTEHKEKELIYSAFRNVILSNTYWRFRWSVLSQLRNLLTSANDPKPPVLDEVTVKMLLDVIKNDTSWVRASAIMFLGMTKDPKYSDIYTGALNDESERVINAAAVALGKSKTPGAYEMLIKLKDKPSWKNQSLISALNGLKEMSDPQGYELAINSLTDSRSPHWTLATPVWDHRLAASETLAALGFSDKAYPLIFEQFKRAIEENNLNDIFYNVLQVITLADPQGKEVFELLRAKYKDDANILPAIEQYESQFKEKIKNK